MENKINCALGLRNTSAGEHATQQTQNICIKFIQCQPNVSNVDPTLHKYYTNGCLCVFLGCIDPCRVIPPPPRIFCVLLDLQLMIEQYNQNKM